MFLESSHYIFYPLPWLGHCLPLSDFQYRNRIGFQRERKKRYVSYSSAKRLRVKVARLLRVREKLLKNIFEVERNLRVCLLDCEKTVGGRLMENGKKETKEKEREVYAIGRPSLEKLSKDELKAFYSTLLFCIIDFYKKDKDSGK